MILQTSMNGSQENEFGPHLRGSQIADSTLSITFLSAPLMIFFVTQGVANRDIKLENTLLDGTTRPLIKICDFGYSKVGCPACIQFVRTLRSPLQVMSVK